MNTAALPQPVVMWPKQLQNASFADSGIALSFSANSRNYDSQLWLQREYRPKDTTRLGAFYGTESHYDTNGQRWSRNAPWHVVDDFGDLVPVPA